MKNMLKRSLAAVMAVASLAVGMVGMSANATTETDNYSAFTYNRSGSTASCSLKNSTSGPKYAQVSMTIYCVDGSVKFPGNHNSALANQQSVGRSYTASATGVEFYGDLYLTQQPMGDPLSHWYRTA